jgi:hypothetical protein
MAASRKRSTETASLAADIAALSPADQLRLAAGLLEAAAQQPDAKRTSTLGIAHSVVERLSAELGEFLMLRRTKETG